MFEFECLKLCILDFVFMSYFKKDFNPEYFFDFIYSNCIYVPNELPSTTIKKRKNIKDTKKTTTEITPQEPPETTPETTPQEQPEKTPETTTEITPETIPQDTPETKDNIKPKETTGYYMFNKECYKKMMLKQNQLNELMLHLRQTYRRKMVDVIDIPYYTYSCIITVLRHMSKQCGIKYTSKTTHFKKEYEIVYMFHA